MFPKEAKERKYFKRSLFSKMSPEKKPLDLVAERSLVNLMVQF